MSIRDHAIEHMVGALRLKDSLITLTTVYAVGASVCLSALIHRSLPHIFSRIHHILAACLGYFDCAASRRPP